MANTPRLLLLLMLVAVAGCGRKNRSIFLFPDKEPTKVSKLELPVAKGLSKKFTDAGTVITWRPITETLAPEISHTGYNIYRLARASVIPKRPLNAQPLIQTTWCDATKKTPAFYVVRAVFKVNDHAIEGPISIII